jgi:DNA-binding transcriptional ArsR family regulator
MPFATPSPTPYAVAASFFATLAEPGRYAVLLALADASMADRSIESAGEVGRNVTELCQDCSVTTRYYANGYLTCDTSDEVSQPSMTARLQTLAAARLIESRRIGRRRYYRLTARGRQVVDGLRKVLD